ncbi:hypothetical protein [Alkaliphilus sp. B6464]|uniref:hypothetical protein n=1 Tax=Alkaliphilus sp. B6464 TaxID=2731219 RepID=UPI001BA54F8B|nr:hypothetical protein [Alkaliphilus sp. B6464]QUH22135.1 hypothetical protein HYG84_19705 [Alkaliphilus sp. B6464]
MLSKRKGAIGIYITISVFVATLVTLNILKYIAININLSNVYFNKVEITNEIQTIKAQVLADLEGNKVLAQKSYQYKNFNVRILPIKFEHASPPDYNDTTYYEPTLESSILDIAYLSKDKNLKLDKYRQYLVYCFDDDFKLYASNMYLGTSSNNGFVLKRDTTSYYGLGNYNVETVNGKTAYLFGLKEWDKYKFNGVYEIIISDTQSNKLKVLVHKFGDEVDELISISY